MLNGKASLTGFRIELFFCPFLKTNCHLIHLHYVQLVYLQNMSAHRQDKLKLQISKDRKSWAGWLASLC